ncbi:Vibriobactin utilization protein ViuB [Marinibacterium anthonyi]|nr:Vibriobactin utilization protein ViuB [Marinibacterium anthonyi]
MYQITSRIDFPEIDSHFTPLLDALAAHQLPVFRDGPRAARAGAGREIDLRAGDDRLDVTIRTADEATLNWMRYAITALIDFNARAVSPVVEWHGDTLGETLPPQLQVFRVCGTEDIAPRMRRIWFSGADVTRYDTMAQIHSRLLFGRGRGMPAQWPFMTDDGRIRWPEGADTLDTRVYTVRHVDVAAGRLAVDFFLGAHDGPATAWARGARVGDGVGFIGPAAHGLIPAGVHVFAGDETGLPGIARCLEHLGPKARGVALIEVDGPGDVQPLAVPEGVTLHWLYRAGAAPGTTPILAEALARVSWPQDLGDCAFWCGAEYAAFRAMRRMVRDLGLPRDRIVAFAHWRRGMSEPDIAAAGSASIRD